jgi:hypothetical protein
VPLSYEPSESGALRQGEVLGNVWEYWVPLTSPLDETIGAPVGKVQHELVIVLTADCDLDQDFNKRFTHEESDQRPRISVLEPKDEELSYVLLCDLFLSSQLRLMVSAGRDIWKRITQNQDERYHTFAAPESEIVRAEQSNDVIIDFKKTLAIRTAGLYEGVGTQSVTRLGVMAPIYLHDLMHRFYGFLSRVGLPDEERDPATPPAPSVGFASP